MGLQKTVKFKLRAAKGVFNMPICTLNKNFSLYERM